MHKRLVAATRKIEASAEPALWDEATRRELTRLEQSWLQRPGVGA